MLITNPCIAALPHGFAMRVHDPVLPPMQMTYVGATRFEDNARLPVGVAVNSNNYAAMALTQVTQPSALHLAGVSRLLSSLRSSRYRCRTAHQLTCCLACVHPPTQIARQPDFVKPLSLLGGCGGPTGSRQEASRQRHAIPNACGHSLRLCGMCAAHHSTCLVTHPTSTNLYTLPPSLLRRQGGVPCGAGCGCLCCTQPICNVARFVAPAEPQARRRALWCRTRLHLLPRASSLASCSCRRGRCWCGRCDPEQRESTLPQVSVTRSTVSPAFPSLASLPPLPP